MHGTFIKNQKGEFFFESRYEAIVWNLNSYRKSVLFSVYTLFLGNGRRKDDF